MTATPLPQPKPRPPAVLAAPRLDPPPRRRRIALALGAVVVATVFTFAAAELVLRSLGAGLMPGIATIYDCFENDGDAHVRLVASYRGTQTVLGRTVRVETNSLGMRDVEHGPKAPGERRVLVLGDSFPFGHGVEADEAFPAVLGRRLQNSGVVVGNGGVPGFSHGEQLRVLQRIAPTFAPDVVVSCIYGGNDFDGEYFGSKQAVDGRWYSAPMAARMADSWRLRLATRSRVAFVVEDFLARTFPALALEQHPSTVGPDDPRYVDFPRKRQYGLFLDAKEQARITEPLLTRFRENIAALRAEVPSRPFVVVLIPHFTQVLPGIYDGVISAELGADPATFERGLGLRRIAKRLAGDGVVCVDVSDALRADSDPAACYLLPDDHLSPRGHAVVTLAITDAVRAALDR